MSNLLTTGRLLTGFAFLSLPAAALAGECTKNDGISSYCQCVYEDALEKVKFLQGDQVTVKKKLEVAAKSLYKCLNSGTNEIESEINKI